ncbi:MAG: OmpA family protein [Thioploca sp.]|nr:OmpA family protein [Thioploca sp.]
MRIIWVLNKVIFYLGVIPFLISCQMIPVQPATPTYLTLDTAIRSLSYNLIKQLQQKQWPIITPAALVINPFVAVESGQVVQTSLDIEALFLNEIPKHFTQYQISRLTPESLKTAHYLINGFIKSEGNLNEPGKKYYQITASILDLTHYTIVASSKMGIVSQGLNYQPTPSYEDNPMYIKDELLDNLISMIESPVGTHVNMNAYATITTKALLVEAQAAYDKSQYELAYRLFKNIIQQPHGKVMEAYGGLYSSAFKLGKLNEAEENFAHMVVLGVKVGNLPVKLLFQPNLTEFLAEPSLRQQYTIWLKQISRYFKKHQQQCVNIIGHTSQYGIYEYNKRLSKRRAEKIQSLMQSTFAGIIHRSKTIGKGPDETIVGTIPDSAENAIDRRVEFRVVAC